jgi:hypothetical protein
MKIKQMLWMRGKIQKTSFLLFKEGKFYECKISTFKNAKIILKYNLSVGCLYDKKKRT